VVAAASDDVIVSVDPNWRPDVLEDPTPWRARLERVLPGSDLIKVSTDDLAHLAPESPAPEAASALLDGRPSCVMVTDGPRDVLVLTAEGAARVAPPRAQVIDTVGAGDAFCAGVLAWCARHALAREVLGSLATMVEAAEFASKVAARTTERSGADPPRLDELVAEM
jgi:fructokinase